MSLLGDEDGAPVVRYDARIDGLTDGTGVAKVRCYSVDKVRCLAILAGFLACEMAMMLSPGRLHLPPGVPG